MTELIIKTFRGKTLPYDIVSIRTKVFIQEQQVPENLEWDEDDKDAIHIIAYYNNTAVGTARFLESGKIGRMAVLRDWRYQGTGKAMLQFIFSLARDKGLTSITLSAQNHAIEFYKKLGCVIISDEYLDAGIPHHTMKCTL